MREILAPAVRELKSKDASSGRHSQDDSRPMPDVLP